MYAGFCMVLCQHMAVPLNKWFPLGKKTFWLFLFRSAKFFIVFTTGITLITYHAKWGSWQNSFIEFFTVKHADWYLSPSLVLMILWLSVLGYLVVVLLRAWVIYRQYKFMMDEHALHIRRGIFFIKEMVIPYHQIQNVEIKQPYLYRPFGLAELDIRMFTSIPESTHHGKKFKNPNMIPIIDKKIAKALAYEIIHRGASHGEAFVTEESVLANQPANQSRSAKITF